MMTGEAMPAEDPPAGADGFPGLHARLHAFQRPGAADSLGQMATSFLPFLALWAVMYFSLAVGYWLTLLLAVPAAAFTTKRASGWFPFRNGNDADGTVAPL